VAGFFLHFAQGAGFRRLITHQPVASFYGLSARITGHGRHDAWLPEEQHCVAGAIEEKYGDTVATIKKVAV
jgi:hypothetical protein